MTTLSVDQTMIASTEWRITSLNSLDLPSYPRKIPSFPELVLQSSKAQELLQRFNQPVDFQIRCKQEKIYLSLNQEPVWHEITIPSSSSLHEAASQFFTIEQKCKKIFDQVMEEREKESQAPRPLVSKVGEALAVGSDFLSLVRNGVSAAALFQIAAASRIANVASRQFKLAVAARLMTAVSAMAVVGGVCTTINGLLVMRNGIAQIKRACRWKDREGAALGSMNTLSGFALHSLGVGLVTTGAATLKAKIAAASLPHWVPMVGMHLIDPAALIMYSVVALCAAYGMATTQWVIFKVGRPDAARKKEEALMNTLLWLKNQVRGADSTEELQKKIERFERRTSAECRKLVQKEITAELLKELKSEDAVVREAAMKKAKYILAKVKIAAQRQRLKHILLMAIAVVGILSAVAAMVLSGPAAPILFVAGAALWLLIDWRKLHTKLCNKLYPDI